jgi:glucokinase
MAKKTKANRASATTKREGGPALGIDLGGSKILAGVVSADRKVLGRGKVKTPFSGDAEALSAALVAACDAALAEAKVTRTDVAALAVAAPGPIDAEKGVLLRANNLAVHDFSVGSAFREAFPSVAPRLENDVRLAALGEAHLGAGKGARLLVAFWVGTGLGGAVVLDGKLWTGRNRNAGEVGQMFVDWKCAKPGRHDGTLESVAAKVGITSYLRRKLKDGGRSVLKKAVSRKDARLKGSELKAALDGGDALARKAVARSARAVGLAIANVFDLISPDVFVLGGGVGVDLGDQYLKDVQRWADAYAFTTELGGVAIVPAALGDDAGVVGAALYARGV